MALIYYFLKTADGKLLMNVKQRDAREEKKKGRKAVFKSRVVQPLR